MAGTLVISTLSDGTNSTSSTNCIQGSAKAWVNFNGTAATIRAAYNVSSITRNAAGNYTVNFTNAMLDVNYAVAANGATIVGTATLLANPTTTGYATGSVVIYCVNNATDALTDNTYMNVAIHR